MLAEAAPRLFGLSEEHSVLLVSSWLAGFLALVVIALGWRLQTLMYRNMQILESQRRLLVDLGRAIGAETVLERLAGEPGAERFVETLREEEREQGRVLERLEAVEEERRRGDPA